MSGRARHKKPAGALAVTSAEVSVALNRISKAALIECVAQLVSLTSGRSDDPPPLQEVAAQVIPVLLARGDAVPRVLRDAVRGLPEWDEAPP